MQQLADEVSVAVLSFVGWAHLGPSLGPASPDSAGRRRRVSDPPPVRCCPLQLSSDLLSLDLSQDGSTEVLAEEDSAGDEEEGGGGGGVQRQPSANAKAQQVWEFGWLRAGTLPLTLPCLMVTCLPCRLAWPHPVIFFSHFLSPLSSGQG